MAFKAEVTRRLSFTGTHDSIELDPDNLLENKNMQIRVRVITTDAVFKLGDTDVTALETFTDDSLVNGNFEMATGAIEIFGVASAETHISGVALDGATAGVAYVTIGSGEDI